MATANEGLKYLNERKEFWQQEQPVYARKSEKFTPKKSRKKSANKKSGQKKISEIGQNALMAN